MQHSSSPEYPTPWTIPRPSKPKDWPAGTPFTPRPLPTLLNTNHVSDAVWNSAQFQQESVGAPGTSMHPVEKAYISNNLNSSDDIIRQGYWKTFPARALGSDILEEDVQLLIVNERQRAREIVWMSEELNIVRGIVGDGMPKAAITGVTASGASSAQDVDRLAFDTLRNKWNDYPKTYECVSAKCAEIRAKQQASSALAAMSLNE